MTARCLLCPASSTALHRCSFMFECDSYSAFFFGENLQLITILQTGQKRSEKNKTKLIFFTGALNNMAHLRLRFKVGMSVIWLLAKVLSSTEKETTPPFPVAVHKKCRKCQHIYLCLVHVPLSQTRINPCLNVFSFI